MACGLLPFHPPRSQASRRMWVVHLVCSDDECDDELEVVVAELKEAERVGCVCGHAFVWGSVSEAELV